MGETFSEMVWIIVTSHCLKHIDAAFDLAEKMTQLADDVEATCDDDRCLVVCSIIRDSAYKIRQAAERESEAI